MGSSVSSSLVVGFLTILAVEPPPVLGCGLGLLSTDFSSSFLLRGYLSLVAAVATVVTLPIVGFSPAGLAIT